MKDRLAKFGFVLKSSYQNKRTKILVECPLCHEDFLTDPLSVMSGKTKSCGCQQSLVTKRNNHKRFKDLTGQKFGKLTVLKLVQRDKKYIKYLCSCSCGGPDKIISACNIKKAISCGCEIIPRLIKSNIHRGHNLIGKTFKLLTVIEDTGKYTYFRGKINKKLWLCECSCGKQVEKTYQSLKKNYGCGDCQMKRNGVLCSKPQLKIANLINRGIINYKIGYYYADIAFVMNSKKILIEYDEWYWHKNKKDKDEKRIKSFLKKGWKCLIIQACKNIPNEKELFTAIDTLANTNINLVYITLKGWEDANHINSSNE